VIIVAERHHPMTIPWPRKPRLVILEATETGWESPDPTYVGYGPEDGVLWSMEKDVCGIARALDLV
jgi:hypothetical protein